MTCFNALLTMDPVQNICWQNNLSELKKQNIKHYLGLKKGKTRRVELTANNSVFLPLSLIHCWISTSCSQNSPSASVKKWEQTLMLWRWVNGEESNGGGGLQRSSPSTAHGRARWGWATNSDGVRPGGSRVTQTMMAYLCPRPQKNCGQSQGWSTITNRKGVAFQRKTDRREVLILCVSDVVRYCKMWREHLWIAPRWKQQGSQTLPHHNMGPQLKRKSRGSDVFFLTKELSHQSVVSDGPYLSNEKSYTCLENILVLRCSPFPAALQFAPLLHVCSLSPAGGS